MFRVRAVNSNNFNSVIRRTIWSKYIVILAIPNFVAVYRHDNLSTLIQTIFDITY